MCRSSIAEGVGADQRPAVATPEGREGTWAVCLGQLGSQQGCEMLSAKKLWPHAAQWLCRLVQMMAAEYTCTPACTQDKCSPETMQMVGTMPQHSVGEQLVSATCNTGEGYLLIVTVAHATLALTTGKDAAPSNTASCRLASLTLSSSSSDSKIVL